MKVGQLMSQVVQSCSPTDTLNRAAQLMWENDCGCVPVVDADGKAVGMLTDRDICMAGYTQGLPLWQIAVTSAASHGVVGVGEEDSLERAEHLMQKHQIRRLPVLDGEGRPVGILSMNDIAQRARGSHREPELSAAAIARTLAAVGESGRQASAE